MGVSGTMTLSLVHGQQRQEQDRRVLVLSGEKNGTLQAVTGKYFENVHLDTLVLKLTLPCVLNKCINNLKVGVAWQTYSQSK